ncbi:hypothetical protein DdX_13143 [Ditylenchus destructor]|uniref:Uncharacterized protein n=1 Tax=Ditylenchus destructor TaxID=166010 RepID=A0AAD4MZA2_9BILA|nr:hypothetical protein DdX_13143 [Ditylenchus destructor]
MFAIVWGGIWGGEGVGGASLSSRKRVRGNDIIDASICSVCLEESANINKEYLGLMAVCNGCKGMLYRLQMEHKKAKHSGKVDKFECGVNPECQKWHIGVKVNKELLLVYKHSHCCRLAIFKAYGYSEKGSQYRSLSQNSRDPEKLRDAMASLTRALICKNIRTSSIAAKSSKTGNGTNGNGHPEPAHKEEPMRSFNFKVDTCFPVNYDPSLPPDKRCECYGSLGRPVMDEKTKKKVLLSTGLDASHHFANFMYTVGLHPDIFLPNITEKDLDQKSVCPAGRIYQSRDWVEIFEQNYEEKKKDELLPGFNYFVCCKGTTGYYWEVYYGTDEVCVAGYGPYQPSHPIRRYFFNKKYHS